MTDATWAAVLKDVSPEVRELAEATCDLIREVLPEASQEAEADDSGLLEGTGRKARHIKVASSEVLKDPRVRHLIKAAAALRFPGRAAG